MTCKLLYVKALDNCRESPPTDWPAAAYVLVGREDLAMACLGTLSRDHESQTRANLISISVPYMLHLQPVTVSSVSEVTRLDGMKSEDSDSPCKSVEDGMEHIFNSSTQLRYGRDLRLNEVSCTLDCLQALILTATQNVILLFECCINSYAVSIEQIHTHIYIYMFIFFFLGLHFQVRRSNPFCLKQVLI